MKPFTIYPAIDLRRGKVVRLLQGRSDRETVYEDEPEKAALAWVAQGAGWIHVVNLDGAFGESGQANQAAIRRIVGVIDGAAAIQLGGGIRSMDALDSAFALGVDRIVLGTSVIEDPAFGLQVLRAFGGERVAFAFDAVNGELRTRGWQKTSGVQVESLAAELAAAGARHIIYTDIERDGMERGVDYQLPQRLTAAHQIDVIASGGTASLDDVRVVKAAGLAGLIIGKALYENNFTLKEALDVC